MLTASCIGYSKGNLRSFQFCLVEVGFLLEALGRWNPPSAAASCITSYVNTVNTHLCGRESQITSLLCDRSLVTVRLDNLIRITILFATVSIQEFVFSTAANTAQKGLVCRMNGSEVYRGIAWMVNKSLIYEDFFGQIFPYMSPWVLNGMFRKIQNNLKPLSHRRTLGPGNSHFSDSSYLNTSWEQWKQLPKFPLLNHCSQGCTAPCNPGLLIFEDTFRWGYVNAKKKKNPAKKYVKFKQENLKI